MRQFIMCAACGIVDGCVCVFVCVESSSIPGFMLSSCERHPYCRPLGRRRRGEVKRGL